MSGYGSPMGGGQGGDGGSGGQQRRQQAPSEDYSMRKELEWVKADMALIRNAVVLLEQEKDHLRQAVRKLKMENQRVKEKLTRVQGEVRALKGDDGCDGAGAGEDDDEEWNHTDYDEIGRHFLLVGGAQDPLSLRFEAAIRDDQGVEHRSAERYYWYKMAEYFGDRDTMAAVLAAPTTQKAEEAMSACKGFDEKKWDEMKLDVWTTGQRLKLEQVRWISNLLVESGKTYIAVADQDKCFGTGWRKNREEANKTLFWDGENRGGRWLMGYRKQLIAKHDWAGPNEQEETRRKYGELKRFVWRRIEQGAARGGYGRGRGVRGGGGRGGGRGGY